MYKQIGDRLIIKEEVITNITAPRHKPESSDAGIRSDHVETILNIRNCFVYVWLKNEKEFWFYPVEAQKNVITGFAWLENCKKWCKLKICINNVKTYF